MAKRKNVKPSISAAEMIMFVPMRPAASGCRAIASQALPPMLPMPRAGAAHADTCADQGPAHADADAGHTGCVSQQWNEGH